MAEPAQSDSSPDTDREFDPTADMLVHDYDDEQTMEEEEALSTAESAGNELDNLEKESEMPIDELLAMYYGGQTNLPPESMELQESRSSSEEEILSNQDLTLDKDEIARDLLKNEDHDNETSVNDLLDSVEMPSQTIRLLRSSSQPGSSDDDSEDLNYEPQPDDDWKKSIQVGSDYQAVIPQGLCRYGDAPAYENEDRLLWDPFKLKDPEVESYLKELQTQNQQTAQGVQSVPQGPHVRDDEQALYLLLQCGHNVEEALRRRKMQSVPPTDPMSLWSEEECRNFENGLRQFGKDFYLVQQNKVKTRSVGELVQFYYLWKKTERHDVFANKTRLEKKKYALHPGVTDYMDRFLDEQDNPAPVRDRACSPNINSLLYGDPKRHMVDYKDHTADLDAALDMVQKVVDTNALALSPLKLHAVEMNVVGATGCFNHEVATDPASLTNTAVPGPVAFSSVGFQPIMTTAGLVTTATLPCPSQSQNLPMDVSNLVPHSAQPSGAESCLGQSSYRAPALSSTSQGDSSTHDQPLAKRLKTAEWTVNNTSQPGSSEDVAKVAKVAKVSDCQDSSRLNNEHSCVSKCSSSGDLHTDRPRITTPDYNSLRLDSVVSSKTSPSKLHVGDNLTSVTLGLSGVNTDFGSGSVRVTSPPGATVPTPQAAESVVQ